MPRIAPLDPSSASGATADHLAATRKMLGGTPNMFTTAAHSPAALNALNGLFAALAKGALGARRGEQIAIAVAQANGCGYCLSAHTALGEMHGLDASALAAAKRGQAAEPKTAALLRLAIAINGGRGKVTESVLTEARVAGISDAEIIEVVAHVGLNVFTNYLNLVAGTEIDFPQIPLDQVA